MLLSLVTEKGKKSLNIMGVCSTNWSLSNNVFYYLRTMFWVFFFLKMLSLITLQLCNQPGTRILQPPSLLPPPPPPLPTPWPLQPLSPDLTAQPSKINLWHFLSLICDPGPTPQRHNRVSFRWWIPPLLIRPICSVGLCLYQKHRAVSSRQTTSDWRHDLLHLPHITLFV